MHRQDWTGSHSAYCMALSLDVLADDRRDFINERIRIDLHGLHSHVAAR